MAVRGVGLLLSYPLNYDELYIEATDEPVTADRLTVDMIRNDADLTLFTNG